LVASVLTDASKPARNLFSFRAPQPIAYRQALLYPRRVKK